MINLNKREHKTICLKVGIKGFFKLNLDMPFHLSLKGFFKLNLDMPFQLSFCS